MNRSSTNCSRRFESSLKTAISLCVISLSALLWAGASGNAARSQTTITRLKLNEPVVREISGAGAHVYELALSAGEFMLLNVEQRGIDVVVSLSGPDDKQIVEVNAPNGSFGIETLYAIAEKPGVYRASVKGDEKSSRSGQYEIKVIELRPAQPSDRLRLKIQQKMSEATQASRQQTKEGTLAAIKSYESALELWVELGDQVGQARTLTYLGSMSRSLGQLRKALEYHQQALALYQADGDRKLEALGLSNVAVAHNSLNDGEKALKLLPRALELRQSLKDQRGEAIVLAELGAAYKILNNPRESLKYYFQSLELKKKVGDVSGEASTLGNIGTIYIDLGETQQAIDRLTEAVKLWREAGDLEGEARANGNLGSIYLRMGEYDKARDQLTKTLEISERLGDQPSIGVSLAYLGDIYFRLGEPEKALDHYRRAREKFKESGVRSGEAAMLANIANVYEELGETTKMAGLFEEALKLSRESKDRVGEANTLSSLASLHKLQGRHQEALEIYYRALAVFRESGYKLGEARILNNQGALFKDLGAYDEATKCYDEALPIFREIKWKRGEANLMNSYGVLAEAKGKYEQALDYYDQAIRFWVELKEKGSEATTRNNLSAVHRDLKDYRKALEQSERALTLAREVKSRHTEAMALHWIGMHHLALEHLPEAFSNLEQSLAVWKEINESRGELATRFALGRAERARGRLDAARAQFETTLRIAETLRTGVTAQTFRTSFLSSMHGYYSGYIDLLMEMDRVRPGDGLAAQALQASEQMRARSLIELLAEARADIRQGADGKLIEQEQDLHREIDGRVRMMLRLRGNRLTAAQAAATEKEIDRLNADLRSVQDEIRKQSPRYAALTQPRPLDARGIQALLDDETLLLEFALGEERSHLWLVTPAEVRSFELPKRSEIEAVAQRLTEALSVPRGRGTGETTAQQKARAAKLDADSQTAATELGRMLLEPVVGKLGRKRLVIVADGKLQRIPFGVLLKPAAAVKPAAAKRSGSARSRPPLIVDHEIVNLPSATSLSLLRSELKNRRPAPNMVMAFADPVFDVSDQRVKRVTSASSSESTAKPAPPARLNFSAQTRAVGSFGDGAVIPRLYLSRDEAEQILKLTPAGTSKVALGFEANLAAATSSANSAYRYIHFATHGLLNDKQPELTGILLSLVDEQGREQNGLLRLSEIYNLKLPAELVVLSACRTALGAEARGEGLIGMTRGFMYAGAPRVVASLWEVEEEGTNELMRIFYASLLGQRQLRPAAALRQAQIAMLRRPQWRSPYYWSAFTLQGEWK